MHKQLINGLIYVGFGIVTAIATIIIRANDEPTIVDRGPNIEVLESEMFTTTQEPETEIETEIETTTEVETETEVNIPILDSVPFEPELQEWIYTYSTEQNVSPYLVYAIVWKESRYNIDITGDNGQSHGLMQIRVRYHQERMDRLGITDLYDPKQNIMVGIDYLLELLNWKEDTTLQWALMAYNGGPDYADQLQEAGEVSDYALEVLAKLEELYLEGE